MSGKETIKRFSNAAVARLIDEPLIEGIAAGGSWITGQLDDYSDLDLILISSENISANRERMRYYAQKMGNLLNSFTGEHIAEPRVLICLFDSPLLHVDIKFLTLEEFRVRVEDPVILLDKNRLLQQILEQTEATFPIPDYQWIEDRFWTWIHYALLKIGRGELLEAVDFLGYLRQTVLGPLLHIKSGNLPRGLRKVETELSPEDLQNLIKTVSLPVKLSLLTSMKNAVDLYITLRSELFPPNVKLSSVTQEKVMEYFDQLVDDCRGRIET